MNNLTQKKLERIVLGVIGVGVLGALLYSTLIRDIFFSAIFGLTIIVFPFVVSSLVRHSFVPSLDSLNELVAKKMSKDGDRHGERAEYFPRYLRVLIWAFVGVALALAWTTVVPALLGLDLWLGKIAIEVGLKTVAMADGVWLYGWACVFLAQYAIAYGFGKLFSYASFDYPSEN